MVVMFDNDIEECPEECAFADLRADVDVLKTPDAVVGLYVTAYCEHGDVCRLRGGGGDGDD